MGPAALAQVLRSLTLPTNPNLLIGLDIKDDAAVYRIADDLALVQTVDFFPPIVDDPYTFGAIAAANALSDVYAMGGRPILALAIAGFPEDLPAATISAILQGGADKVAEAGAVVAGGHTVIDQEPKYGLCVTGLVHPDHITAKARAQPGDLLLLTKPLGTGVITTAHKRGVVAEQHLQAAIDSMVKLNRRAAELAASVGLHSATDITGYGLLGHAEELARNSGVALQIVLEQVPLLPGAHRIRPPGHLPWRAWPQPRLSAWRGIWYAWHQVWKKRALSCCSTRRHPAGCCSHCRSRRQPRCASASPWRASRSGRLAGW